MTIEKIAKELNITAAQAQALAEACEAGRLYEEDAVIRAYNNDDVTLNDGQLLIDWLEEDIEELEDAIEDGSDAERLTAEIEKMKKEIETIDRKATYAVYLDEHGYEYVKVK